MARMSDRVAVSGHRLVLPLVAVGSACIVGGLVLLVLSWSAAVPDAWGFRGFAVLPATAFGGVGALLASRRPKNRLGWVLLACGLAGSVQLLVGEYAVYGIVGRATALPGAVLAGWATSWIWLIGVTLIVTYTLLLFPNGSLVSPRWRIVGWLAAVNLTLGICGLAFASGPLEAVTFLENPFPLLGELGRGLFNLSFFALMLLVAASAGSLVVRYRRAAGAERQQLRWLALEGVLIAIAVGISFFAQVFAPDFKPVQLLFLLVLCLLPVAIGIAITRYRLYDIDLLINRTLVYGAVVAAVVATYFAAVVAIQAVLRPFTSGSELAVAGSTLLVVALFQPLRRRVQDAVDRRFYRSRYDAARTLDAFGMRLRSEVDLDSVGADLLDVVGETLSPAHTSLWLRGRRQ